MIEAREYQGQTYYDLKIQPGESITAKKKFGGPGQAIKTTGKFPGTKYKYTFEVQHNGETVDSSYFATEKGNEVLAPFPAGVMTLSRDNDKMSVIEVTMDHSQQTQQSVAPQPVVSGVTGGNVKGPINIRPVVAAAGRDAHIAWQNANNAAAVIVASLPNGDVDTALKNFEVVHGHILAMYSERFEGNGSNIADVAQSLFAD